MAEEFEPPDDGPPREAFDGVFHVYEARSDGGRLLYFGQPDAPKDDVVSSLWSAFREEGYELYLHERLGEYVLVAEPRSDGNDGVPWTNVVLFLATALSTLLVGAAGWYYVPVGTIVDNPLALLEAWPFTVAVLGVLGIHELGHYAMSRYHGVDASLPYFIPVPTIFGTMGAVIRMRGKMPDRKALFDIGVAGPLAGLAATVVVTVVGLTMDPVTVPAEVAQNADGTVIRLRDPPLLELLAGLLGEPLAYDDPTKSVNPVVIGGWVGMFVTFLNLVPVGQLDGGHMLRAMLGHRQESINALVPLALFGLAGYLYYGLGLQLQDSVLLWTVWGGFAMLLALNGPASPVDETPLGWRRVAVGLVTFAVGLLCFTPVPFEVLG
jgi:membrane-associated protease RseP (regulator of RpoE activity)